MNPRTPGPRAGLWAVLCIGAAITAFFFPVFFTGLHMVPFHLEKGAVTGIPGGGVPAAVEDPFRWPGSDTSPITIHYPNATFVRDALAHHELPLWNPFVGCGEPGLGNGQVYPFSPFLWPFYLWPTPWVFTLGLILGAVWGAFGVFLWMGRFDLAPWQRGLGAALVVINPWTVRIIIFSNVWAAWWFGWLLWSWEKVEDPGERRWWLPALFITGMVYCGHPETGLLLAAASAIYAAVAWLARPSADREGAFWLKGAVAVALSGALTAVHWLPVLRRLSEALPYKVLMPGLAAREHYTLAALIDPRTEVYLAPALLGLVLVGVSRLRGDRRLWAPLALLLLAALVLFHPVSEGGIGQVLTGGGLIPARYGRDLVWFVLALFAATGAGWVAGEGAGNRMWAGACFGLGLLVYGALVGWNSVVGGRAVALMRPDWVLAAGGLFLWIGGATLLAPGRVRTALLAAGFTLLCLDPFVLLHGRLRVETPYAFNRSGTGASFSLFGARRPLAGGPPAIAELRARLGDSHGRFVASTLPWGAACLTPDLATLWRVRDVRVTDVLLDRRYTVLHESFQGHGAPRTFTSLLFPSASAEDMGLLGVRFAGRPIDEESGRVAWHEVPGALPRAFLAHRIVPSRDEEDSFRLWNQLLREGRLHEETIVEGWTGPAAVGSPSPEDRVEWREDGLSTVRLNVASQAGGVLILLDTFAEGWQARVDGGRVPILPANLAFRAVAVPPGAHEVEFRYEPASVRDGLVLSACGWLALAGLAVAGRRRRVP